MRELILTVVLYLIAVALVIYGGLLGIAAVAVWLGVGAHFVASSNSRGLVADASFLVTWPIYVILGK